MAPTVRLVFVVHDHQPVGNFDDVIERAYQESYRPFLDLVERHAGIRIALHTSGPLAEWLDRHHPDYLDRLAALAAAGRLEIVGGAFYEPVLAMLPARDRIGQITRYSAWLERRLGANVSGMWVAERVWDPGMARDIAQAGISWTILDDAHFKAAGLADDQLDRHWLTEGDGATLAVFPVSERLRYVIPFAAPEAAIDHLRFMATRRSGALAVFGDDGEKFGAWPDTHRSCSGTVWLPECSYREMTEWVLPPEPQLACIAARQAAEGDPRLAGVARFIRGGSWRNFRLRYPEANEMYARMMAVSTRLDRLRQAGVTDRQALADAELALYRGQCNCSYWHGAFGGIYLPHLRNAVYHELIAADLAADRAEGRTGPRIDALVGDFDFDGRPEIRLANDALDAWLAPAKGGMLYELDLHAQRHNILATLDRRPEAYHAQVLAGPGAARSIVDPAQAARFKQAGLERLVRYDGWRRKSLVDHFWDVDVAGQSIIEGAALERGDFAAGEYVAEVHRSPDRIAVTLTRTGNAWGIPFTLAKSITMAAGSSALEIAYQLTDLPPDFRQHLAVEFNFAGLPANAAGRFFADEAGRELGDQSEGGFELVHQSVVVMPHWIVTPDAAGRWGVTLRLDLGRGSAPITADTPASPSRSPA